MGHPAEIRPTSKSGIPELEASKVRSSFPGSSDDKASAYNAGNLGSIPESGRSLEKGMATHSSIHAWKIPRTKEPDGLQTMGSQRVAREHLLLKTRAAEEQESKQPK